MLVWFSHDFFLSMIIVIRGQLQRPILIQMALWPFFLAENSAVFKKSKLSRKKRVCVGSSRNLKREQGYSNNTVSLCSLLSQSRLKVKFYYTAVAAAAAAAIAKVRLRTLHQRSQLKLRDPGSVCPHSWTFSLFIWLFVCLLKWTCS